MDLVDSEFPQKVLRNTILYFIALMALKESVKLRKLLLRQDFAHSPIRDIREMSHTNGRLFPTDPAPISKHAAPLIPQIDNMVNLYGQPVPNIQALFKTQKVAILALNMSTMAAASIQPYKDRVPDGVPLLDVHVIVGRLKAVILSGLCRWQLRRSTEESMWKRTFCVNIYRSGLFGNIGAWNRYGAYIYLVDQEGRARWRCSGPPLEGDVDRFVSAVKMLNE